MAAAALFIYYEEIDINCLFSYWHPMPDQNKNKPLIKGNDEKVEKVFNK